MIERFKRGHTGNASSNFKFREFECHCGKCVEQLVDTDLIVALQKIRDHFGKPVYLHSAYRCETQNAKSGGVKSSLHCKGQAADIYIKNIDHTKLAQYCEFIGLYGIGLYNWGVHIDTRPANKKFFWKTDKQIKVATFLHKPNTVEFLQEKLNNDFGCKLAIDGKFGAETKKAVLTHFAK